MIKAPACVMKQLRRGRPDYRRNAGRHKPRMRRPSLDLTNANTYVLDYSGSSDVLPHYCAPRFPSGSDIQFPSVSRIARLPFKDSTWSRASRRLAHADPAAASPSLPAMHRRPWTRNVFDICPSRRILDHQLDSWCCSTARSAVSFLRTSTADDVEQRHAYDTVSLWDDDRFAFRTLPSSASA